MSMSEVSKIEDEIAQLPRDDQYELLQRLVRRLRRDDPAMRREKLAKLSQQMREWAKRPPDRDDAWWDDFERELRENRLTFRVIDFGWGANEAPSG